MPTNYSIYTIPTYYTLNMLPHLYSAYLMSGGSPSRYNNANPKANSTLDAFRKRVPAATYQRWERARAAHSNGFENLPLLVAAVVLGNMAQLDVAGMSWTFGSFLLLRAAYAVVYVNVESQRLSHLRSVIYNVAMFQCLWVIVKAGNVLSTR